jgi:hypothetical protein
MNSRSFILAAVMALATVPPQAWSQTAPVASSAAGLSAEKLNRLRQIAASAPKASNLDLPVMNLLGLGKDGDLISVKQFKADTAIGLYVFTLPVKPASDDVLFSFRDLSGVTYTYLSDSTRMLRAAMASDADGNRMLSNAEAAEGFQKSLNAWGLIAPRVKFP